MKIKRYLLLVTFLSFFSCNDKKIEEIKPVIKTSIESSRITQREDSVNKSQIGYQKESPIQEIEDPKYSNLNKYSIDGYYLCESLKNIKAKLDKPINLVVKKDGSTVYVMNGFYSRTPLLRNDEFDLYDQKLNAESQEINLDKRIIKNSPIIKITKNKEISFLETNKNEITQCTNDGVLAIDEKDNLYTTSQGKIYNIWDEKYVAFEKNTSNLCSKENNNILEQYSSSCDTFSPLDINRFYYDNGNFYIQSGLGSTFSSKPYVYDPNKDKITNQPFILYSPSYITRKISKNNDIFFINSVSSDRKFEFTFKNDKIFFITNSDRISANPKLILKEDTAINDLHLKELILDNQNIEYKRYCSLGFDDKGEQINYYEYYHSKFVGRLATNSKNEVYISDKKGHKIWKANNLNDLSLIAGSGKAGYKDSFGKNAEFNFPTAMAFDAQDNLYIADTGNNAIRKITPEGEVSTFYKEKE